MTDIKKITNCTYIIHPSLKDMGIEIDNLNLIEDNIHYILTGDLFIKNKVCEKFYLNATAYDSQKNTMESELTQIDLDTILDFYTFKMYLYKTHMYEEISDVKIFPTFEKKAPKITKKLKKKIERISHFEDELGVNFKKLSIKNEGTSIEILGDIFIDSKDDLDAILVKTSIYNEEGYLLGLGETTIDLSTFLGFDTFSITIDSINPNEIDKITLYPKGVKN